MPSGSLSFSASTFAASLNAGRVQEAVARYAPDAVLMAPGGEILSNREGIERYWAALAAGPFRSLSFSPFRSSVADSVAYETGTYELRLRASGGKTVDSVDTGQFVTVYKRGPDGTWRVVYDVLNNLPPARPLGPAR